MNNITRADSWAVGLFGCLAVVDLFSFCLFGCLFVNVNMDKLFNLTRQVKGCNEFLQQNKIKEKKKLKIKQFIYTLRGLVCKCLIN